MSLIHRGHETEAKSAKAPCVSLAAEEDCEEAVGGASLVAGSSAYMESFESSMLSLSKAERRQGQAKLLWMKVTGRQKVQSSKKAPGPLGGPLSSGHQGGRAACVHSHLGF